jgi:pimeloyl-ACP methyl ester carboxylesterase
MVHGLHSTPLAWQQLTNELLGDPEIRRRYQIWHYLYPTGLPFLTSAADFRDEIEAVRQLVDPADHDFATHNMIVIGHSMGGLLARTLITDSGDAIWDSTFAIPVSQLDQCEQVSQLRRIFYFHPKPYIKRAIFIAVPHRGSKTAHGFLGQFVSMRVDLPGALNQFVAGLKKSIPGLLQPEAAPLFDRGYPDSIRTLAPNTPVLIALAKLPIDAGTPFHSIIGDRGLGGGENSSDGVVPYSSSHLAGASSETIVPAGHGACDNPEAIAEVKRILTLHVADSITTVPRESQAEAVSRQPDHRHE